MTEPGRPRCLVRGGGDLATGVVWRLHRSGFPTIVTELADPLTVRRSVALSTAVADGRVCVEGLVGRRVDTVAEARDLATGPPASALSDVPVLVAADLPDVGADVVVDARMAKRNIDTAIDDGPLVVAIGPGFTAGIDCDAVVETMRGPRLGRVIWTGPAAADTGVPGTVGGHSAERVLRAPVDGAAAWGVAIGDRVLAGDVLGSVAGEPLTAPFDGVVRGLIRPGSSVVAGTKIADVDPRADVDCDEISDKALAVGGGVLEAVMTWWTGARG